MHFDQRSSHGEVIAGVNLGAEPGHIFFSRRGPRKGQAFPLRLAQQLQARREGLLLELPRRSVYLFFGFARYYLKHGVPFAGTEASQAAGQDHFDRVSLTWRAVPEPAGGTRLQPPWPLPASEEDVVWGQRFLRAPCPAAVPSAAGGSCTKRPWPGSEGDAAAAEARRGGGPRPQRRFRVPLRPVGSGGPRAPSVLDLTLQGEDASEAATHVGGPAPLATAGAGRSAAADRDACELVSVSVLPRPGAGQSPLPLGESWPVSRLAF